MISLPDFLLGRKSAVALVLAGFAALFLLISVPVRAAFEAQRENIDDTIDQIAQYQAISRSRPALEATLSTVRSNIVTFPGLVHGVSAAAVAADMQGQIKQLVDTNAGQVRSSQFSASAQDNGLERVSVDCDFTIPITHLRDLLYATETHDPFFFITRIEISSPMNWQPNDPKAGEPVMEVRWTVQAYRAGRSA